jgi:hypothetical protein
VASNWTFIERRRPGCPRMYVEIEALIALGRARTRVGIYPYPGGPEESRVQDWPRDHSSNPQGLRGRTGARAKQTLVLVVFLKAHWKLLATSDFFTIEK